MSMNELAASLPEDVRDLLEGGGRRLEAHDLVLGVPTFLVVTYRVDYGDLPPFNSPTGVIKFSMREHAIPDSAHIKLGSSRYYRECEDGTAGVADPEEGRLVQRGSVSEFRKKNRLPPGPGIENASTTVTWAGSDFLMFCTSIVPKARDLGALQGEFPDYDCVTDIADPSAFAMQLGRDIGKQFAMINVRLDAFDMIRKMKLAEAEITTGGRLIQKGLDTVVLVTHGPVTYRDRPETIVNRFPIERRSEVVPFVKRQQFAGQQEYRFVIGTIGVPTELGFLLEITDDLRRLTNLAPC